MNPTLLFGLALLAPAPGSPGAEPGASGALFLINEVRVDQIGADNDEYFEIFSIPSNSSLDGLTYLVIGDAAAGSGVIENVTDLTGFSTSNQGLFLAAESTFSLSGLPDLFTSLNFENNDNVTHLLVRGFSGANGDDLDTDDDGTLDVTPWTAVVDAISFIADPVAGDQFYGSALGFNDLGPNGNFAPAHAFRCLTSLSDWRIGLFGTTAVADTPRAFNTPCNGSQASFCNPAEINQTGVPGEISLSGNASIQQNSSALVGDNLPNTFGVFVQSDTDGPSVVTGIGGNICLSGNIVRMNQIVVISGGQTSLALDFTDPSLAENGNGGMFPGTMPGETWYYQLFYRDSVFAGGGNFTNGVAVTWVP